MVASTLITISELEDHVETDLPEAALQRLIDAADRDIIDRYGPHTDQPLTVDIVPKGRQIFLPYPPAVSITSIKEYSPGYGKLPRDADDVSSDNWQLVSPTKIIRVGFAFQERAIVTYVPVDDTDQREHMLIDVVNLAIVYEAEKISGVGEGGFGVSTEHFDYRKEREAILSRLLVFSPGTMFA